jgi:hypothetical protein
MLRMDAHRATAPEKRYEDGTHDGCSYDVCQSDGDCQGGVCDCRESPAHVTWGTQTVCLGQLEDGLRLRTGRVWFAEPCAPVRCTELVRL